MSNRLLQEMSPYLQQHADNPVDWYTWNDDTLRCAREQDKLVHANLTAWFCRGTQCLPPIIALDELRDVIRN